jgi:RimJ/RimL family protein N-acetyltransferase
MDIRPAQMSDADTLFQWRNDPLTRAMSRTSEPVSWEAHIKWLSERLGRSEPHLYIAEIGAPVGTFRLDGDEISYTIAPESRGKGLGFLMLCKVREMFGPLRAEIYGRNAASIRVAEKAGMQLHILTTDIPQSEACHPRHYTS